MTNNCRISRKSLVLRGAVTLGLVTLVLATAEQSIAGDGEGINGFKVKIFKHDGSTPPGGNGPVTSSTAGLEVLDGDRVQAERVRFDGSHPYLSIRTLWLWLQVKQSLERS